MEEGGGKFEIATNLCASWVKYYLTICWFFTLKDCHATNMPNFNSFTFPPKILLEHHEQEWRAPKLLNRLKCESEVKITKEQGVGDTLPGS
jgi:hypothetical protein